MDVNKVGRGGRKESRNLSQKVRIIFVRKIEIEYNLWKKNIVKYT